MASRRWSKLKEAFSLVEERLKEESNRLITEVITNEAFAISGEGLVNTVIARTLHDTFASSFTVKTEVGKGTQKIDICLLNKGSVILAIEGKWMVSNSTRKGSPPADALDVSGIKNKLQKVMKDITDIGDKIDRTGIVVPHYEIFVPIVCELYRTGGESELFKDAKPWATDPRYREVRENLKRDLKKWFICKDDAFKLIHATKPIELVDASRLWQEQSAWLYPKYKTLEAYVSFYAFGRYVGK